MEHILVGGVIAALTVFGIYLLCWMTPHDDEPNEIEVENDDEISSDPHAW